MTIHRLQIDYTHVYTKSGTYPAWNAYLRDYLEEWLDDNTPGYAFEWNYSVVRNDSGSHYDVSLFLEFTTEEHLLLYKLTWL